MNIISVQMTFKIHFRCGNLPLFSGVIAVPSGPKSHTFTVILAVQDGIINCESPMLCNALKPWLQSRESSQNLLLINILSVFRNRNGRNLNLPYH